MCRNVWGVSSWIDAGDKKTGLRCRGSVIVTSGDSLPAADVTQSFVYLTPLLVFCHMSLWEAAWVI